MISRIKIKNFRSILDSEILIFPYTVFIGENNAGKSNILKALETFFTEKITLADLPIQIAKDGNVPDACKSVIEVEFRNLKKEEKQLYNDYLIKKGCSWWKDSVPVDEQCIVIRKRFEFNGSSQKPEIVREYLVQEVDQDSLLDSDIGWLFGKYQAPEEFMQAGDVPNEFKELLEKELDGGGRGGSRTSKNKNKVKKVEKLINLYKDEHASEIEEKLESMEKKTTWKKFPRKSKDLFKSLGDYFFVPAVQDIEKETTYQLTGNTNINKLVQRILDELRNQTGADIIEKKLEDLLNDFYQIDNPDSPLKQLEKALNDLLKKFNNSRVIFQPKSQPFRKFVRDSLKVQVDDGVVTDVKDKGHGLQRYFLVLLFKAWSDQLQKMRSEEITPSRTSSIYFGFEEPELFLHPQYQRIMRWYLKYLTEKESIQVLLNTHSPNFIEYDDIYSLVRVCIDNGERRTIIVQPFKKIRNGYERQDLVNVYKRSEISDELKRRDEFYMKYLLDSERMELFFAKKVVLVEGQTEKTIIPLWAKYFLKEDDTDLLFTTTFVDCLGKRNVRNFMWLLGAFKIPFIAIHDTDIPADRSNLTEEERNRLQTNKSLNKSIKFVGDRFHRPVICIEPDFEERFNITGHNIDEKKGRRFKPWIAINNFIDNDGNFIKEKFEELRNDELVIEMFKQIYGVDISAREDDGTQE